MDDFFDQIKRLAAGTSCKDRHGILCAIQEAYQDIEGREDTLARVRGRSLECCVIDVADELNIFRFLVNADRPLSTEEIAKKANASPGFIRRILCFLAARLYITETGEDRFISSKLTQTLALDEFRADVRMNVRVDARGYLAFPRFLKMNGYRDVTNPRNCPLQLGCQTKATLYEWVQTQPELNVCYNDYMLGHHKLLRPFTDVYPIEDLLDDMDPDQPFFVDVGGGYGHQALAIKVTHPYARVILEELPLQLQDLEVGEDVELLAQDYFKEQKVKGARIYYLRHILNACPDSECAIILRRLADAMDSKSVILIDEAVMPSMGATYHATLYDMAMICLFGTNERTKAQWEQVLAKVGRDLRIRRIVQYSEEFNYAITEVVKCS